MAAVAHLGAELSQVQDLDILLDHILTLARGAVLADAGSIFIREDDNLRFSYTQNDTLSKRLKPGESLVYSLFSLPVSPETIAGYVALTGRPLNIPDCYAIPPDAPYRFGRQFDEKASYRTTSSLTLPMNTSAGRNVGVLQVINPRSTAGIVPFTQEDQQLLSLFTGMASMAIERAHLTRTLILRMIQMAEMRDPHETGTHCNRVAGIAVILFEEWAARRRVEPRDVLHRCDVLRMAAMVHDVGKVAVSDFILRKPAKLDRAEFEHMKHHVAHGARLFMHSASEFDHAAYEVTLYHHERWDGTGYLGHVEILPDPTAEPPVKPLPPGGGLKGDEIPVYARVVALADVFDALSSRRCYKVAWDEAQVLAEVQKSAGTQFDPELVEILMHHLPAVKALYERYQERV
jgi:HD-GYP domain-containing protein (c-di-GMP phosphodiesterase class II)